MDPSKETRRLFNLILVIAFIALAIYLYSMGKQHNDDFDKLQKDAEQSHRDAQRLLH